jgi:predicted transposase/invertase (TIGR01784 family)
MKFADITNDIAFRKIFGNEVKKKALISFLNAVIDLPHNEPITDVELINPYQLPKLSRGKTTIVDIKARDEKGNSYIIEMQIAEPEFFHKRILYYTSQSYASQIGQGTEYNKLKPVYFIGILEFTISNNPNYFSRHKVLDVETNEHIIRDVEFNLIELPKFNKTLEQLQTPVDQWTYFIKNASNLTVIPENVTDEGLKEAYLEADRHSWTQPELDDYERAAIREADEINILNLALKRAEQKAEAKFKEILQQAEEKQKVALQQAEEEKEKQTQLNIAKQARQMGLSTTDIAKLTGLSETEIENL